MNASFYHLIGFALLKQKSIWKRFDLNKPPKRRSVALMLLCLTTSLFSASAQIYQGASDGTGIVNGPMGSPDAIGPSGGKNDDFTNKSALVPQTTSPGAQINPQPVGFSNTVKNTGTTIANISLLPAAPSTPSDLPIGTRVILFYLTTSATYIYDGTAFTFERGTGVVGGNPVAGSNPIRIDGLATNASATYGVEIDLPDGTPLSTDFNIQRGFPVTITAFVDANGNGVVDDAVKNNTIDRCYTGYLQQLKQSRILQGTGPAVQGNDGRPSTPPKKAAPGNIIEYVVQYQNISEPQSGVGNVILDADKVIITEDGTQNPNNWAAESAGEIYTSNIVGSASDAGAATIQYFSGNPATNLLSVEQTGNTAASDVSKYTNSPTGKIPPGISRTFRFQRLVNQKAAGRDLDNIAIATYEDANNPNVPINSTSNQVTVTVLPTVSLSVSTNVGTEAGTTIVTVTATASASVAGDQTVSLGVSGTGITTGDYTLLNATITIQNGQTSGGVTFTVVDDALVEGTETATLTISNPSSGIALGSPTTQDITITDNDCSKPNNVEVTGGGSYCAGGAGVSIGLSGSESGVTYQLKKDNEDDGLPISGIGTSAVSFGTKTAAGTYTVVATRTNGGCTALMPGRAVVSITPIPVASALSNSPLCAGQSLNLSANGGDTYTWAAAGFSSNEQNPTRNPATTTMSGTYTVTVSNSGCTATATTAVQVNAASNPTVSSNSPLCVGGTLRLSVTGAGAGATYSWGATSPFGSTLQNPTRPNATVAMSGTYSVTVRGGCSSVVLTTSVVVSPNVAPSITSLRVNGNLPNAQTNTATACTNAPVNLNITAINAVTYSWRGPTGAGSGFSSSLASPVEMPIASPRQGQYTVTVRNGCQVFNQRVINLQLINCSNTRLASAEEAEAIDIEINAYPNPVSKTLKVEVRLKEPAALQLKLLNSVGQESGTWQLGEVRDFHQTELNLADLLGGVYLLQAQAGKQRAVKRVVKIQYE